MIWGIAWIMGVLVIGSIVAYVARQATAVPMQEQTGPAQPASAAVENKTPVTGSDWAAAYVVKLGGDKIVEGIKSARFVGTLTAGGRTYALEILKKAPNLVRFQLEDKEGTLMLGSDGQQAWVAYRGADGNAEVWDADEATRDWLWLQTPLGTWLAHPNSAEAKFVLEAPAGAAPTAHAVSVRSPGGRKATYYLDAGDLMPRRLELHDAPAGAAVEAVDLEDYHEQQNIRLPYKLEVEGPNGPAVTVEIKKVIFNSGMINAAFERPVADDNGGKLTQNPGAGGTAISAVTPAGVAPSDGDTAGLGSSLKTDFDANAMHVHNFVAQTNVFQNMPPPRIEQGEAAGPNGAPVSLADYGFPWPLPW